MSPLPPGIRLGTRIGTHQLTRTTIAGLLAALVLAAVGGAAGGYRYPRFQPVSIAFIDVRHGVLAEDDWVCQRSHGCEGRILVTKDGGSGWRVTFTGARGVELFPVRGRSVVYALTGDAMIESSDAGRRWHRLDWGPAVVSFVTPAHGWRLGRVTTLAHPPPLYETRDGGRSWSTRVDPCKGDSGVPAVMSFASKTRGWSGLEPYRLDATIEGWPEVAATIARLGATMDIRVSEAYQALRVRVGCTAPLAGASQTGCYLRGAQTR
jgi:hypothetical protein